MKIQLPVAWLAALLIAGPAFAAEPAGETQATAKTDTGTAAQIEAFLKAAPPVKSLDEGVDGVTDGAAPDRKLHGVVELAVGSHGYRSVYLESTYPLGETGSLTVALSDRKGGYYGGYYGDGYDGYLGAPLPLLGDRQVMGVGLSIGTDQPRPRDQMRRSNRRAPGVRR